MRPIMFAHRGARAEEPENTIAAFRLALRQGATGLESDARLSADGEVVLAHDARIRRGLRGARVDRTPAARLGELGVPRLAELYETLGTAYELSIYLKVPGVATAILEVARAHGAIGRLWLCSGSPERLREVRAEAAAVRLVHSTRRRALGERVERHVADLAGAGVDVLNMPYPDWSAGLVSLCHRFSLRAFAWDAQDARRLRALLGMGIDAVYADRVDRMVATISEWVVGGP